LSAENSSDDQTVALDGNHPILLGED